MSDAGVLDKVAYQVGADIGPFKAKMGEADAVAQKTGQNITGHFERSAKAAEHLHRGVEVSRRELLYLGREVATGDLRRIPSTLVLIGSHLAGITSEAILMGGAIVAPFALMVTAGVQAEKAAERVRLAIARTGDAAGVTAGQLTTMARAAASSGGGLSERGALDVASTLTGGGNVPGSVMQSGIEATNAFSKISGLNLDKSGEEISRMMEDPAKAAKELHDKFKLLTDAELLRIQGMKSSTQQEKELFDALIKRGHAAEDSLWSLSKAFDSAGSFLSNLWFHTGSSVLGSTKSPEEQLKDWDATRASAAQQVKYGLAPKSVLAQIDKHRGDLHYQIRMANQQAATDEAKTQKDKDAAEARSAGALEIQKYRDEARIAGLSPRDREMARARADAARQYQSNLNNPDMVKYADGIKSGSITAAQSQQNASRRDALKLVQQQAAGEDKLADAYRTSVAAGLAMEATNKAHQEFLKGAIDDEKSYSAALLRTAMAQRDVNAAKQDAKQADSNAELALEISMLGVDEDLRAKQVALLKAKNDVIQEGFDLSKADGQAELARRQSLISQQQDDLKLKKDITEEQQRNLEVAKDGMSVLGTVFDHANQGAAGLKNLLPDITSQILGMTEKLAILNPLENLLTGKTTGTAGKLPTFGNSSIFNKLGNWIGSKFGMGGAWSGGVRYAANGMVLGGATAFATHSGPVVGGELGMNSEALMPLARGPSGSLGVRVYGGGRSNAPVVHQHITIHPDVGAVARGEMVKMLPSIQASAVEAFSNAVGRGFVPGGVSG